ncbi:MAG: hypothetical protein C0605_05725 [Hyphomicrobiales bacterium]|nr:MAG: hypothetical protein C0605_05725 [Hyphomicrobiales bacterium]
MRISGKLVLTATAGAITALLAVSVPKQADAQSYGVVPGEGFERNIYIDGRSPIDKETRDKVDAYEQSYRDKQRAKQEHEQRLKDHFYGNLISRGRSEGRF